MKRALPRVLALIFVAVFLVFLPARFSAADDGYPMLFVLAVISWACCIVTALRERAQSQPALA